VIVAGHVATGALAGAFLGTRGAALLAGPLVHLAGDLVPHTDLPTRAAEVVAGAVTLAAVAARCGAVSPAVLGAVAAAAPDAEHLRIVERRRHRKLFPSHRYPGLHRAGGLPAAAQLAGAAAVVVLLPRAAGFRRFALRAGR
jgi:hypothetical protein